jgi:hypothetical protein
MDVDFSCVLRSLQVRLNDIRDRRLVGEVVDVLPTGRYPVTVQFEWQRRNFHPDELEPASPPAPALATLRDALEQIAAMDAGNGYGSVGMADEAIAFGKCQQIAAAALAALEAEKGAGDE